MPSFPNTPIQKNFNSGGPAFLSLTDADFSVLGGATGSTIGSGVVTNGAAAYVGDYVDSVTFSNNQEAWIELAGTHEYFGVFICLTTPGGSYNGYQASWATGANGLTCQKLTSGSQSPLGSSVTLVASAGDALGITRSGNNIYVWTRQSGVYTLQITTSDASYTGGGAVGFDMFRTGATALDNFGYGEFVEYGQIDNEDYRCFPKYKMRTPTYGYLPR